MAGITERNQQKVELANSGFSMRYIDEWQPKTTLYRHKASLNVQGELVRDIGTTLMGVPGNPDYVLRKARIGMFPWKPGVSCDCKWCKDSYEEPEPEPEVNSEVATKTCEECGFTAEAANLAGASSKLTFHKRKSHPDV
jgi:hypothetical protein